MSCVYISIKIIPTPLAVDSIARLSNDGEAVRASVMKYDIHVCHVRYYSDVLSSGMKGGARGRVGYRPCLIARLCNSWLSGKQ